MRRIIYNYGSARLSKYPTRLTDSGRLGVLARRMARSGEYVLGGLTMGITILHFVRFTNDNKLAQTLCQLANEHLLDQGYSLTHTKHST